MSASVPGSTKLFLTTFQVKLIFTFLLSYPLCGLLKRLPDSRPELKNVYIVAISTFYLVGLFDLWTGVRTLFISAAGAYAIAKYIDGPLMPWVGFVFLMGHMSVNHIWRHLANTPEVVDVSGAQMVLVMKLTSFCWNIHDGRLPEKDLTDHQKEYMIKKMPSLLNYAAYVLFFPSLFAGPSFEYNQYERWLTTQMFDLPPGTDPARAPPTRKKRKIPRSGTPAIMKAATGLVWILVFLQATAIWYPGVLLNKDYLQYNFLRRVWILWMVGFTVRMKFYGVWFLAEGACILAGIGFKGIDVKTGRANWSGLQNVDPWGIELAQNTRAFLGFWNINTNMWLRNYMYLRVTPKGKKPGFRASMATFVTSAFWHGFEPGYYLAFVLAAFLQTLAKNTRRLFRPFFLTADGSAPLPSKKYYDVASWLVTQATFAFAAAPFYLLSWNACITAWSANYYFCLIITVAGLAFFNSPAKGILIKQLKAREGRAASGLKRPGVNRFQSTDSLKTPNLGLPDDPAKELDEAFEEARREIEARFGDGQGGFNIKGGSEDIQKLVEEKVTEVRQRTSVKKEAET